jgi:DNA topoisomerase IB
MLNKIEDGVVRIGKDLRVYESKNGNWKVSGKEFPNALKIVSLFKAHNNFDFLLDNKNNKFLKGQIFKKKVQGARINVLPTGEVLDKAYSLFAEDLTIHDESSHDHWDVIYRNPNGKYAYLYTLKKKNNSLKNKYKKVELFSKVYNKLQKTVVQNLSNDKDIYALPLYTMLKTCMRVGNETHYKETGHKGLTTLKKSDIKIKDNVVSFDYIAKSGVPLNIEEEFPLDYIKRLKNRLKEIKNNDFVFANGRNQPLKDTEFMKAFENYCGYKFYPHIIRSYYATKRVQDFLKLHHNKVNKQEVKNLFLEIAEKLGHKRFDKKSNDWKNSYTVTIHHYIQPELVEKLEKLSN